MFFQIYGDRALWQWGIMFLHILALILLNEIARRTKAGGIAIFVGLPVLLSVYFIAIQVGVRQGAEWALNSQTYLYMNGWFHYAKLYAADLGCVGFILLKYKWSIGKKEWFKVYPFLIVAINILIAVASDLESAIKGQTNYAATGSHWWLSNEHVWMYGGWWNVFNAIAGLLCIFCMTGWWGIYSSKGRQDMLWPDMTIGYIIVYDIWNFTYTYLNMPIECLHSGVALLLAPTIAALFWNKGGWIQNRAFTLAMDCMFAQVLPTTWKTTKAATVTSVYGSTYASNDFMWDPSIVPQESAADPTAQGLLAVAALVANAFFLGMIIKRARKLKVNPYKNELWIGTKDYEEAMARAE